MPWRNPPNRSAEYRKRAEESRAKADSTTDDKERATLLQTADTWKRMADWEDVNNPPHPVAGSRQRREPSPVTSSAPDE